MVVEFANKNVIILNPGGNYLYVEELLGTFRKIGAPYYLMKYLLLVLPQPILSFEVSMLYDDYGLFRMS